METETPAWQTQSAVCRCCLSKDCHKDIATEHFWMGKREVYEEMLTETFDLTISVQVLKSEEANSFKGLICDPCILRLRDAAEFKRQVLECEKTFHKYLELSTSANKFDDSPQQSMVAFVKIEVKSENATLDENVVDENNFVNEYVKHDDFGSDDPTPCGDGNIVAAIQSDVLPKIPKVVKKQDKSKIKRKKQYISRTGKGNTVKSFICDNCQKIFKSKQNLKLHFLNKACNRDILVQTETKSHKCDVCKKNFSNSSNLYRHRFIHTGEKPYKCEVCKKCFRQLSDLQRHGFIHTGEKPYRCDVCEKGFSYSSHLREHRLIHTGQKPHKCDVCRKSFGKSSDLLRHKMTHTGEKPHQCDICKKGFRQLCHLRQHRLAHTGEKPYKCDICKKGFSWSSCLYQHKQTHTGEKRYTCDICNKSFSWSSCLQQHKLTHTGEKPYKCDVCEKCFIQSSHLARHRLIHSGDRSINQKQ